MGGIKDRKHMENNEELNKENEGAAVDEERKEYTNDDIIILLGALPENEREILLNNFTVSSLKRFVSEDGYKSNMEAINHNIVYYILLKDAVEHLYFAYCNTNQEANRIQSVVNFAKSLDREQRTALGIRILAGNALSDKLPE